jgi:hypothetical protein
MGLSKARVYDGNDDKLGGWKHVNTELNLRPQASSSPRHASRQSRFATFEDVVSIRYQHHRGD